ncbi:MAG TPA: type II toxin-antitoxin system VapC family toxin [Terracidiphilus sp.]|jgi:PIN domain nuclease of toxin-antitoxin system
MRYLLDTQLCLWIPSSDPRVSPALLEILGDDANSFSFSAVSIWEIAIKRGLGKVDFRIDPRGIRSQLFRAGYDEMTVTGIQAVAVDTLPLLHKDPFDRLLIAQAMVEGIILLTTDRIVARYSGPIQLV